jgi:hypothetical protein
MSSAKKKDEDKEKKFLGKLSYRLDYDFEKNTVPLDCERSGPNNVVFS